MFTSIRQLMKLVSKSDKVWIIPVVLLLVIIALLVIASQISPVPVFLYPIL